MWRAAITLLLALPACTHHTRMVPAGSMAPKLSKLTLNLVMDRSSSYADSDCAPIASAHALRVVQGLEKALAREGLRIVPGAAALTGRVHSLFETCGESDDEFMSQVEVKIEGPKGAVIVVQGGISAGDLDDGIARMIGQMIDSGELTAYASGTLKIAEKKPDEKPQAGYVAVFDISDGAKGFPPGVMQQVTDYLIERVAASGMYRVVPRVPVKPQPIASMALSTKIVRDGTSCALSSTLKDLRTKTPDRTAFARIDCGANGLLNGAEMIADQLLRP